jgi:hypothetical protein
MIEIVSLCRKTESGFESLPVPGSSSNTIVKYSGTEKSSRVPPVFRTQEKIRLFSQGSMKACRQSVKEAQAFIHQYPPKYYLRDDGYRYFLGNSNLGQVECLEKAGFFDFHQTNAGQIVYEHQVEMFLFGSGHRHYRNGYYARKGEVEIHHLDNNRANNNPWNLRYVSPALNLLCARAIQQPYNGELPTQPMPESPEEALEMMQLTLRRFLARFNVPNLQLSEIEWLQSLPYDLKVEVLSNWSPPAKVCQALEACAT